MICHPDYFYRCLSATMRLVPLRMFDAMTGGMRRYRTLLLMHSITMSESAGTSHHHAVHSRKLPAPDQADKRNPAYQVSGA